MWRWEVQLTLPKEFYTFYAIHHRSWPDRSSICSQLYKSVNNYFLFSSHFYHIFCIYYNCSKKSNNKILFHNFFLRTAPRQYAVLLNCQITKRDEFLTRPVFPVIYIFSLLFSAPCQYSHRNFLPRLPLWILLFPSFSTVALSHERTAVSYTHLTLPTTERV